MLPFVEKIVAMDCEKYLVDFAKPFYKEAGVENKIDFRVGDAIKTMEDLEAAGETFDMVFIDADKGGYWNYYDKVMSSKSLLRPDGIIIAVSSSSGESRLLLTPHHRTTPCTRHRRMCRTLLLQKAKKRWAISTAKSERIRDPMLLFCPSATD